MMRFGAAVCLFRCVLVAAMLFLAACKSELNTNLSEEDANEILATLLSSGVSARKEARKEGIAVLVSTGQFGEAVEILRTHGLPRRRFATVGDVFQSEGIVASPLQEWAKFNFAKAQELSKSLSAIPGVIRADVHLGETRKESPFEEVEPPSASVLIQMDETLISENFVTQVKQLVSLAHPNIEYDRVGVVVTPVKMGRKEVPLTEVAGILVHNRDAGMLMSVLAYAATVTVGLGAALTGFALQRRKIKLMETPT
jgi:type III secretion protein J